MAMLSNMTSRQWLGTTGLFLAGGCICFVILTFFPSLIIFGIMVLAYAFLEMITGGAIKGIYRIISWPFHRNQPKPAPDEEPANPINPWPIRYAFVLGFSSYFALAWVLTYNGVKGYM